MHQQGMRSQALKWQCGRLSASLWHVLTQVYTTGQKFVQPAPIPSYLKTAAIFAVVWYIIVSQQRHCTTAVRWPMWLTRGFVVHAAGVRNWARLLQYPARAP